MVLCIPSNTNMPVFEDDISMIIYRHAHDVIRNVMAFYEDTVIQKIIWYLIQMLTVRLCLYICHVNID